MTSALTPLSAGRHAVITGGSSGLRLELAAQKACLPRPNESRGRIVNASSMAGMLGAFGLTAYGATERSAADRRHSRVITEGPLAGKG